MKRKTAGENSLKAQNDKTKYDPLEIGTALTDEIITKVIECAEAHKPIFDEPEYFVCLFIAGDPLLKNVRRHKYAAFLHLPSPRPQQVCFLYNKITGKLKRLWSLPNAAIMAWISETKVVAKRWKETKGWCDAFFKLKFWEHIRHQHGINHLSEVEYLKAHREEFLKAGAKENAPLKADPFDFSKIKINHIVDTKTALPD